MLRPHIFREYDIRGVVGRDLDASGVERIGRAFGTLIARGTGIGRVAIGRDCRLTSPELAAALASGIAATGHDVVELGMVPTPVLYFNAHRLDTDAAVQLTGSHNPPDYNGLKMIRRGGGVYGSQIAEIRDLAEAGDFESGQGKRLTQPDAVEAYADWIGAHAELGPRQVKLVIDAGNGAGGPTALAVMKRLGIAVVPLYCEPDGRFPNHHPDPTIPEALDVLRERVRAEGADFGVGFDGDADRIGVVDTDGRVLWGDMLLIILARDLLKREPGATIVGEVKCSQTLFDDVAAHGGRPIMWKVGHSLIKAKMKEEGALLAGEMSGHLFFEHRFFGFDDAIYAATRLAEILSHTPDGKLGDHLDGVPETFATPEIRLDAGSDAIKFAAAAQVAAHYRSSADPAIRDIVTIDGVRVIFDRGWGLVRASNTQPVLVMRAEATTAAERDRIEAEIRGRIEQAIAAAAAAS